MVNKWVKVILITVAALLVACVAVSGLYAFGAIKVKAPAPDNQSGEQAAQETQSQQSGTLSDGLNMAVVSPYDNKFNPIIEVNVYTLSLTVKPSSELVAYLREISVGVSSLRIDISYMSYSMIQSSGTRFYFETFEEFVEGITMDIFDLPYFGSSHLSDVIFKAGILFNDANNVPRVYSSESARLNLAAYTVQDFEDAYNEGEKDGFYDGYGKGKTDGQAEGEAKGFDNGYAARDGEAKAYLNAMTLNDYLSANGTATIVFLSSLGALILYLSGLLTAFAVRYFRGC